MIKTLRTARILGSLLVLLSGSYLGRCAEKRAERAIAFIHVTVIPMDRDGVLKDRTVVVAGERIRELGPTAELKVPTDAVVIDGRGKYLMPGLADMHTHTFDEKEFTLLIANGVTAVRNMFGSPLHLDWRRRIEAGDLAGPTIYTAGPIIDGNPPMWPGGAVAENAERARRVISEQQKAGYNFVKVYWGLSKESYDAVIDAAKVEGMPVVGHVPTAVGLAHALRSGQKSIEHLTGYEHALATRHVHLADPSVWARLDESRFAEIARETAKADTWNCPTLVLFQNRVAPGENDYLRRMLDRPEMKYVSPETVRSWHPENNYLKNAHPADVASTRQSDPARKKLVKALHEAGARLLLGTDYPNPFVVPGFSVHDELRNLVDAGFSPYEAIRAGTSGAAEFLGYGQEFGTVAVGQRADLILVEGNPLEDVANVGRRTGVMVRGRWHSNAELTSSLERLAKEYARKRNASSEPTRDK